MNEKDLLQQKKQAQMNEDMADAAKLKAELSGASADTQLEINQQLKKENDMNEKDLYQQKKQAQLDELKAEVAKLKAKASGASADAQMKINKQIKLVDNQIKEGKVKLSELTKASNDAWETLKDGVESAWDSLKLGVKDAASKFKE
jgi:cell division septum initiation protein DivIVA